MSNQNKKSEEQYSNPQNIITIVFFLITVALAYGAYHYSGWQFVVLFIIGWLIGYTLFHARYGFASVYRQIVETGNTEMLRGHMIKLIIATTLFALIINLGIGLFGVVPAGALSPITVGLVVGSFLFGFGMEFGSGLAPASMRTAEGGRTASVFTVLGFLIGATVGAFHFQFWNDTLPNRPEFSLIHDTPLGFWGSLALQTSIFVVIAIGTYIYNKSKRPPDLPKMPRGSGWAKFLYGTWPIWVGAVVIAVLNAAVLVVQGSPWKLTAAFTTWGSKIADNLGFDVSSWGYWGEQEPLGTLSDVVFTDDLSVLNFGVISGALITMSIAGLIRFSKIPPHLMIAALIGGLLMGYGATISFGANVGAYFSGLASLSLHAWIWAPMAIAGVYVAYYTEKKFGFLRAGSKGLGS
ncbi:YeeE/YedE family protein [Halalkalibacillus halophilus]|uniref:YeeE/YedE family protein n=1 Tax=Halalkalibacillus halophilus TaxID=392827 RepID=UPI0004187410|nr:YeeE/YedE family protein [Halalkalibacillus halophilus]